MFYTFNKDKLISYGVTVLTIMILFLTASIFKEDTKSIQTSANESRVNNMMIIQNN